jgi:hypothetical protein
VRTEVRVQSNTLHLDFIKPLQKPRRAIRICTVIELESRKEYQRRHLIAKTILYRLEPS